MKTILFFLLILISTAPRCQQKIKLNPVYRPSDSVFLFIGYYSSDGKKQVAGSVTAACAHFPTMLELQKSIRQYDKDITPSMKVAILSMCKLSSKEIRSLEK